MEDDGEAKRDQDQAQVHEDQEATDAYGFYFNYSIVSMEIIFKTRPLALGHSGFGADMVSMTIPALFLFEIMLSGL